MSILSELRTLSEQLNDQFIRINYGGCGVVAYQIAQHLQKIVPTRISVFDDESISSIHDVREVLSDSAQKYVDSWNDMGVYFGHIVVEFKYNGRWYHMDSDGVRRKTRVYNGDGLVEGFLELSELKHLNRDVDSWNKHFNRRQVPRIRRLINKFFKDLKPEAI